MAIPRMNDDMNIISKLGNVPGSENGLSPQQIKERFDLAGLLLQGFINDILIPGIENTTPGLYALTMDLATVVLAATGWDNNTQTVQVEKVIANSNQQAVIAVANAVSVDTYLDANIKMTGQGTGSLTFTCDDVPETAVALNLMILTKGG